MKKKLLTLILLVTSLTLLLSACGEKKSNEATAATNEANAADNQSNDAAYEHKEFTIGQYTFETTSAREVALIRADKSITSAYLSATLSYQDITYTLTSIGNRAFWRCSALTSVTIPNSVTSIGEEAFDGCSSLTSVTIPNSVTSIGDQAFGECSRLTSVTIPNSVKEIGSWAFGGCKSLTSVTIPNSVKEIGSWAFGGTALYEKLANWENGALYIDNCLIKVDEGFAGHFRIKENTRLISEYAFCGCSSLTSVSIPNSVTSIGNGAFCDCSSLTSVTIPNRVTSIGWKAFSDCSSLTSITIPNGVTSIGEDAFGECSSLISVTIPNSVTSIGYAAFSNCSALTSITIPNGVTSIEGWTFGGCKSLTSVTIPNSVKEIGSWAFGGTALYEKLANWENGALYINYCLIEVDEGFAGHFRIKENTRVIADRAFSNCSALTSITIPNSVKSIGSSTFKDCSSLTSVTIPNGVKEIGDGAFEGCESLTSVTIPNSVTRIGWYAFKGCEALTKLNYNGTQTSWDQVVKNSDWMVGSSIELIHCRDAMIAMEEEIVQQTVQEEVDELPLELPPPPPPPAEEIQQNIDKLVVVDDDIETQEIDLHTQDEEIELILLKPAEVEVEEEVGDEVFFVVEKMPEFPGGQQAMMKFIAENIKYPVIAQENGIQGRVICQFVVEKDGKPSNIQVVRTSGDASLDKEAVRVIDTMPKWKPGMQRGQAVRVTYTLPVSFRLSDEPKESAKP